MSVIENRQNTPARTKSDRGTGAVFVRVLASVRRSYHVRENPVQRVRLGASSMNCASCGKNLSTEERPMKCQRTRARFRSQPGPRI